MRKKIKNTKISFKIYMNEIEIKNLFIYLVYID